MTSDMQKIYTQLISGIQTYFKQSGISRGVVGLSGGVDSALTLKLAVDALGADKITAVSMPEHGVSSSTGSMHAKALAEALDVEFFTIPINQFLMPFNTTPWPGTPLAAQNLKARIRMTLLYHFANCKNALVLGTSNKSEILLGYGTKFGDLACDIEVPADLYKEEVVALANFVGLPPEIVNKKPSAELYPDQTDESELGASYSELDPILKRLDLGMEALIERGMSSALVHNVFQRVKQNKHKSELPAVIKIV
jgi:NAD+ synthase